MNTFNLLLISLIIIALIVFSLRHNACKCKETYMSSYNTTQPRTYISPHFIR